MNEQLAVKNAKKELIKHNILAKLTHIDKINLFTLWSTKKYIYICNPSGIVENIFTTN